MLKTVKNGSGIRVDPPPCFFKIPTFSRYFFWGASLILGYKQNNNKTKNKQTKKNNANVGESANSLFSAS